MLHFISTSDWHLDGLKKLFPNDHIQRQLAEVEKIFQYAMKKGIQHVFIPGDISDSYNMSWDAYFGLINLLTKYDGLLNIYYLHGNHDWEAEKKTSLDLLNLMCLHDMFKTVHLYNSPEQIEIDGVVINMLAFPAKKSIKHKKPCLNFVHASFDGAIGDNGRTLRVKTEIQCDKRDFTISGHIHQYQHMKAKRVIYNGNPFQKNFGESLPKGFIECKAKYVNKKLVVKHQFINNHPDFTLESKIINSQKDFTELSTSDSVRYRLYVDPGVVVPSDLMIKYPNIRQIFDSQGKTKIKELECADEFKQQSIDVPKIDPTFSLASSMKNAGWRKKDFQKAKALVAEAMSVTY